MKQSIGNPAPGFKKHPDHRVTTKPAGVRVRATFNGEAIADSRDRDAITLEESKYPPVYYLPRKGVRMQRLFATLSRYAHVAPGHSDADLRRGSSGPVVSERAV